MNLPDVIPLSWKIGAAAALFASLAGAGALYHHHVYQQGYDAADAEHLATEARNSARAKSELDKQDAAMAVKQAVLDTTLAALAAKQKDLDHEKGISAARQSDLLAGRERLRVLATKRPPDPAGQDQAGAAARLDQEPAIVYDLAPAAAGWIDRLRTEHNAAVTRLGGCIEAYDAAQLAVNKQ